MAHKRLLSAYAHPDDEQGVSGLMRKYASEGVDVTLVCRRAAKPGKSRRASTRRRKIWVRCTKKNCGARRRKSASTMCTFSVTVIRE